MATTTRRRSVELPEHPDFLWTARVTPKKVYDVIIIGAGGHGEPSETPRNSIWKG